MAFFVSIPVSLSGMFGSDTAWNYRNSTLLLQPMYKLIAVIAFICQYEFAIQIKRFQQSLCHTDIVVLSNISVVSSTNSCSIRAVRISSHTPAFAQARNRLYTLCHGPNRSGRSRHGIPEFSQYRIALSISRLLFPGRPPCGFFQSETYP